ncbi:hypothetical protein DENSPDRAFT_743872, partial [Dentipellis sp. KUC8613]
MSFQNFRLDGVPLPQPPPPADFAHHPYPPPVVAAPAPLSVPPTASDTHFQIHLDGPPARAAGRGPYGSGDMDDGYTLVFESMAAFEAWREKEEEDKVVEFVKGDTHGSKAVPPRFKEHVKLVCARHSRSGRKKYVKKFPDRVRKVPSRKLEGKGCPAAISYKTYFDKEEVRVCYVSQHSHEIGPANLPFTRRGRRAQAARPHESRSVEGSVNSQPVASTSALPNMSGSPSGSMPPGGVHQPPMRAHPPEHPAAFGSAYPHFPSMSMAPPTFGSIPPPTPSAPPVPAPGGMSSDRERMERERWDRMDVLFQNIRNNARHFEYPPPSVAALESVLVRMYFESPLQPAQITMMGHPLPGQEHQQPGSSSHDQRMHSGSESGEEE